MAHKLSRFCKMAGRSKAVGARSVTHLASFLVTCRDNDDQPIQKTFISWLFHFATLCLCWMRVFARHLIFLSLTKPTMHPKHLLYRYVSPSLVDILFELMQIKLGTFLPIHCCAVWFLFNLKYIFVSLCKYTLRMKLLTSISSITIWR